VTAGARRILANTTYRFVADLGAKVASVALYVVIARKLGDAQFGVFTFGLAVATMSMALSDFGQDRILTREVARDHERVHGYFANTLALKLVLGLPALALAAAVLVFAGAEDETVVVMVLLGLGVLAELLMATCFATYQSYERLAFIPVALLTQRWATAIGGIAAVLLGAGLIAVSAIYFAGSLLSLGLSIGLLFHYIVRPRLRLSTRKWWSLMRVAFPIGLAGIFSVILFRIDSAMLAAFESNSVVGDYGAAYRLFESTLFLSWSVGAAVYPVFSRLRPDSEPPVAFVFQQSLKLLIAVTLPLAVGAAVLSEPVIDLLYGSDFEDASTALALLAPAIALFPVSYVAGYLLVSQDRPRAMTIVYGLVAAENVLLNFVLIPSFSLDGAALGTSISQLLVAIGLLAFARPFGSVAWKRVLAGPCVAGALAAAAMLALHDEFALAVAAGAIVYLGALVGFERAVFPDDAREVLGFLRRKGLARA
jgi:O-antigen/teichoic acid export membrane protein